MTDKPHQPKGSQCASCLYAHRDCSNLPFDTYRAIEETETEIVVICQRFERVKDHDQQAAKR